MVPAKTANTSAASTMIIRLRAMANADPFVPKDRKDMSKSGHEASPPARFK
jgi:hypothetical protein